MNKNAEERYYLCMYHISYSTISYNFLITTIITADWNASSVESFTFQDLPGVSVTVYLASSVPKVVPTGMPGQHYAGPCFGLGKALWGIMYDEISIRRAYQRPALYHVK